LGWRGRGASRRGRGQGVIFLVMALAALHGELFLCAASCVADVALKQGCLGGAAYSLADQSTCGTSVINASQQGCCGSSFIFSKEEEMCCGYGKVTSYESPVGVVSKCMVTELDTVGNFLDDLDYDTCVCADTPSPTATPEPSPAPSLTFSPTVLPTAYPSETPINTLDRSPAGLPFCTDTATLDGSLNGTYYGCLNNYIYDFQTQFACGEYILSYDQHGCCPTNGSASYFFPKNQSCCQLGTYFEDGDIQYTISDYQVRNGTDACWCSTCLSPEPTPVPTTPSPSGVPSFFPTPEPTTWYAAGPRGAFIGLLVALVNILVCTSICGFVWWQSFVRKSREQGFKQRLAQCFSCCRPTQARGPPPEQFTEVPPTQRSNLV